MRKIAVLMATAFIDMLGVAMIFPLIPFYALRLRAEPWVIGLLLASFSVAQIASAPLWGRVSDRYGRRPALLVGLASSAAAFLIFAFATQVWLLFLSRIVQGLGGGTTGVAQAYIGDTVAPRDRAKALGWLSAATSAGVMIGPAMGSFATTASPAAPGLIAAALCLINVAFAWRWLPEPDRHSPAGAAGPAGAPAPGGRRSIRTAVLEVLRRPAGEVSLLIWIYAVGMLGFMSMTAVLALYLKTRFAVTERTIGWFFLYSGALSLVMRGVVLGRLVERLGEARVMRLGSAALALGLFAIPMPPHVLGFAAVMALVPIGTACLFPATSALVSQRASRAELGQTLGVQQAFGGVARILAPVTATAAFQGLGPAVPFRIAAAVVALVAALSLRVQDRSRDPGPPAAPPPGCGDAAGSEVAAAKAPEPTGDA